MKNIKSIRDKKTRRAIRIRSKIALSLKPRLTVFRSNNHFYAQIIDDQKAKTLVSASDAEIKTKGTKIEKAEEVGKMIAQKAAKKKISEVAFDKGSYKYHGRVKTFAESARKGGLVF